MNSDELFLNQTLSLMFANMDDASIRKLIKLYQEEDWWNLCADADHHWDNKYMCTSRKYTVIMDSYQAVRHLLLFVTFFSIVKLYVAETSSPYTVTRNVAASSLQNLSPYALQGKKFCQ